MGPGQGAPAGAGVTPLTGRPCRASAGLGRAWPAPRARCGGSGWVLGNGFTAHLGLYKNGTSINF